MDKRIRRNEFCVVGLPRCDFVFSSTRTCFIGYGFVESALEKTILKKLLAERDIEPVEAGGTTIAPGQNAFCAKICSRIIISQFCVILVNNDMKNGVEVPNANVNIEYGLMLGFNKYVIPLQRTHQTLPFNVAGLDTVKYANEDFEQKATTAIDAAIVATRQDNSPALAPDQVVEAFLLSQRLLFVPINTEGDRNLFEMGRPLGFNMLMTFDGMRYVYFGNFTALRPETVLWRLRTFADIVRERVASVPQRVKMGLANPDPNVIAALESLLVRDLQVMLLVTSKDEREAIEGEITLQPLQWPVRVFSLDDIAAALQGVR
ncbi:MAG TPA: hypothetical protein VFI39_04000 [Gemmatimonadales bacterium]|nr:hypothetical protein [Gemmatimonadales bacterium]